MRLARGIAVKVVAVHSVGPYRLRLEFTDGHASTVDLGPFLRASMNPETRRFLNARRFRDFHLLHGNIVWGDYEMCFPIEDLYEGVICHGNTGTRQLVVAEEKTEYGTQGKPR
jgi:hypothetical protein